MWPRRLARPGPALLGARARRECDYTPAAGHTRRPLGPGAAAPQLGRPHPGNARGPPGSQPPPSCGCGVIFHTAVPRKARTRSGYVDFPQFFKTRVLGGRSMSSMSRPDRTAQETGHIYSAI